MFNVLKFASAMAAAAAMVAGCTTTSDAMLGAAVEPAISEVVTDTQSTLRALPPPRERAAVAVYNFDDQTGQFKPSSGVQTLSKAVTQGATSVLLKALQDAGNRSWFTVIERENLDNLLKERQIIREMRRQYLGEEDVNEAALPPLLFAGIILEGGIIGYDSNTVTGGAGARFLGIGAKADYREDKVTVYLRAVSVKTGEVITTVVASKKIASVGVASNVFRYVSFKELLEVDTGITTNEPDLLALRQATEKAVELLVLEGADLGVWGFQDRMAGAELLERYRAERDGVFTDMESAYAANSEPVRQAAIEPQAARNAAPLTPHMGDSHSVPAQPAFTPAHDTPREMSSTRMGAASLVNATYQPDTRPAASLIVNASMPLASGREQNTAQTISAVPAAVLPVAQGDGEFRQTAADFYNASIGSLPALRGNKVSIAEMEMRRVASAAARRSGSRSDLEGA